MFVLIRNLVLTLAILGSQYCVAGLPQDADRSVDVNLAGFLYSQGLYKSDDGLIKLIDQSQIAKTRTLDIPTDPTSETGTIKKWLQENERTIKPEEIFK